MTELEIVNILYPHASDMAMNVKPGPVRGRRFTQDTPVMAEVWLAYGATDDPDARMELLLTPNSASSITELVRHLRIALARLRGTEPRRVFLAWNESHVVADLTFRELVCCVLPLSCWWRETLGNIQISQGFQFLHERPDLPVLLLEPGRQLNNGVSPDVLDMVRIVGALAMKQPLGTTPEYFQHVVTAVEKLFAGFEPHVDFKVPPLWSVFSCRQAHSAVSKSRLAIKADAAARLFEISCRQLVWAIVDSGIDAEHHAFHDWPPIDPRATTGTCDQKSTRVIEAWDFTRIRKVLKAAFSDDALGELKALVPSLDEDRLREIADDLGPRLLDGRPLDWTLLEPLLRLKTPEGRIPPPVNEHGTHVAGILGGDWRKLRPGDTQPYDGYKEPGESVIGICPDIRLYDLRVIGDDGSGDEFNVLSALQFVRYLNMNKDKMVVHGVNLSFSLPQQVKSFGCGSSPICSECDRLVNSGVVVVTAAGNRGYVVANDGFEWYRSLSITDPGNADSVITVGATHRTDPHRFGVSYFSSRGPTGDGRSKPDLVAPGEKINSVVPGSDSIVALDGTSMAAPHVSGAAAMLMARHSELIGKPRKIKEVLCSTATDLGREKAFQGSGMLDVLRALQAV